MKNQLSEFACNAPLVDYNGFSGVTYGYATSAKSESIDNVLYEYVLMSSRQSIGRKLDESETRARREIRRNSGKKSRQSK